MWQLVRVVHLGRPLAGLDGTEWVPFHSIPSRTVDSQLRRTACTNYHKHTLLPPDDGLLASLKPVEVQWMNKLKINSASSWFHYAHISRCTVNKTQNTVSYSTVVVLNWCAVSNVTVCCVALGRVREDGGYYKKTWQYISHLNLNLLTFWIELAQDRDRWWALVML
jgi:hypothetical protein